MPYLAFAANFLWVLVLGLLGPSVPAILADLGIGYTRVGLFFALMSLGSLFGTSLGAMASDYVNRKALLLAVTASFVAGLVLPSVSPGWMWPVTFVEANRPAEGIRPASATAVTKGLSCLWEDAA